MEIEAPKTFYKTHEFQNAVKKRPYTFDPKACNTAIMSKFEGISANDMHETRKKYQIFSNTKTQ